MSHDNILNSLKVIVNPNTGKTLNEEGRIVELKLDQNELLFKYKRDGISPEQKKVIENLVVKIASPEISSEKITVLTVSEGSADVFGGKKFTKPEVKKSEEAPAAQIKTGHGPAGQNKKRVLGAKKVIAVSSCKGGVGKSTVSVNLAFALKNQGKKVGLLDADIYGPSMPMLLNQRGAKPGATEEKKILPIDAYGIPFISFGLFVNEKDPVIWRGPMLGGVLNQFLFDVAWEGLDYLIIDLPPGTGDMQLSMIQATDVDGVIVVSTPQDVAVLDSKKGLNMFNQVKVPILGMVENMSYFVPDDNQSKKYFIFGEGGVKKAAEELNVNLLAEIPLEIALREGSDNGKPYMNEKKYEGRPVWNAYMSLAKNVDECFNTPKEEGEPKGFFKRLFS
ncbi:MAG: Mrp/NBP35 family ATP-binding protein [Bacteriovoracaceae bacterium]|nr:Mrp/NBP35 family ATP-binding protein [Bacteriovoracaceae bacterium]